MAGFCPGWETLLFLFPHFSYQSALNIKCPLKFCGLNECLASLEILMPDKLHCIENFGIKMLQNIGILDWKFGVFKSVSPPPPGSVY